MNHVRASNLKNLPLTVVQTIYKQAKIFSPNVETDVDMKRITHPSLKDHFTHWLTSHFLDNPSSVTPSSEIRKVPSVSLPGTASSSDRSLYHGGAVSQTGNLKPSFSPPTTSSTTPGNYRS